MTESCVKGRFYAEGHVDIRNNDLLLSGDRPIVLIDDDEEEGLGTGANAWE
jgi:hypothetical protein